MANIHSFLLSFVIILLSFKRCLAQLVVESPAAGKTFTVVGGEVTIPITWEDDGDDPTNDEIASYTFVLCTGPNDAIHGLQQLKGITPSEVSGDSYSAVFDASMGADGLYYVQIYCTLSNGGYLIRYTNRVELSGMSGTYAASGTGSSRDGETDADDDAASNNADTSASFTVPYTLQTGKTRFAPMQMQPNSEITVSTWSRRFPSSAVTYYSTFASEPKIISTKTPGWSYTMSSFVNYATPAPFPSEVGWYAASQRLVSATLDASLAGATADAKRKLQKRRWAD